MRKVFTKLLSSESKFLDLPGTLILKLAKARVLYYIPKHWGYEPDMNHLPNNQQQISL